MSENGKHASDDKDDVKAKVDWAELERMDFESLPDLWAWVTLARMKCSDTFDIMTFAEKAMGDYIDDISQGNRAVKAYKKRQVTKHIKSMMNHLTAMNATLMKIKPDLLKALSEEIDAARRKNTNRKKIDLTKGI